MPGSVSNAVPATVMPHTLCKAFRRAQVFPLNENTYKNGESQRLNLAGTSRKSWEVQKRLASGMLDQLRDFYEARKGQHQAFYFYDLWETSPPFTHDATGVATLGRYTVRFASEWSQADYMVRLEVPISLVELA